jgi:hypothetical protein
MLTKILRVAMYAVAIHWIILFLIVVPTAFAGVQPGVEAEGEGVWFLMGMATLSFFALVIYEKRLQVRAPPVAGE